MKQLFLGPVTVDLTLGTVLGPNGNSRLTRTELLVMRRLVRAEGATVSRATLLVDVWQLTPTTITRCVDSTVHRLRRKIEIYPKNPSFLLREYGEGYRLASPVLDARPPNEEETNALIGRNQDIQRVQQALAGDHRAIALVGPVGAGLHRLADACALSDNTAVFTDQTALTEWLQQRVTHRGILLSEQLHNHSLLVIEVGPLTPSSARDLLRSICRQSLDGKQVNDAVQHAGCLPSALVEHGRNIDVFGPEFALTLQLLSSALQSRWDTLTGPQQQLLRAVAEAPASVPVRALAAIADSRDVQSLREACWFQRTDDRFDLTAPARRFIHATQPAGPWTLVPWLGQRGRSLFTEVREPDNAKTPHPHDIAALTHAARIDDTEHATWALLGAVEPLRKTDHSVAESLLTRHLSLGRSPDVRSALYAVRSSVYRVLTQDDRAKADADQAAALAVSDHTQMLAHAAIAYANILCAEQALPHLILATSLAKKLGAKSKENAYLAATGACHRNLGDLLASQHALERALASAPTVNQRVSVRLRLAMTLADNGDIPAALRHMSVGIDDARSQDMPTYVAIGYANLGFVQLLAGADPTQALDDAEQLCARIGYDTCHGIVLSTQALYAAMTERFEHAERLLHASLARLAPSPIRGMVEAWLARLELAFGRPDQSFDDCLRLCESDNQRLAAVRVLMGHPAGPWPKTSLIRLAEQFHSACRRLERARSKN